MEKRLPNWKALCNCQKAHKDTFWGDANVPHFVVGSVCTGEYYCQNS